MGQRRRTVWDEAFDELTPEAMYWAGFLFADGTIARAPQVQLLISRTDRAHLEHFRRFLRTDYAISEARSNHWEMPDGRIINGRGGVQLRATSPRLHERLTALGMRGPAPDAALVRSPHFWRGVWDGDGSLGVYDTPKVSVVGHPWLMKSLRVFLLDHLATAPIIRPHRSIVAMRASAHRARAIVDLLYRDAPVALPRKAVTAQRILAHEFARTPYRHQLLPPV